MHVQLASTKLAAKPPHHHGPSWDHGCQDPPWHRWGFPAAFHPTTFASSLPGAAMGQQAMVRGEDG